MKYDDFTSLQNCKKQIEKKLNWGSSAEWKQRDFLNLIELLEADTGISLSLSTIKRIWKEDYKGTPQPTTLDAFAQFLGYKSWLDYKAKISSEEISLNKPPKRTKNAYGKKVYGLMFLLTSLSILLIFGFKYKNNRAIPKKLWYNKADVEFSCNNSVSSGVPNTIIFSYDIDEVEADSFFIQQSWNTNGREKIERKGNKFTSMYYYPGFHKAKLIANDSIIKEIDVRINTNEWLALAGSEPMQKIPTYIKNKTVRNNNYLHVTREHLISNGVELNKNTFTGYTYVNNFNDLSSGNFSFETRLKCDSLPNIVCPKISILILGESGMNMVMLTTKGCVGDISIFLGDVYQNGKNNDLSKFGVDIYNWQKVKIDMKDKKATVIINEKLAYELLFNNDIGEVVGTSVYFSGTGSLDFAKFSDEENHLVYAEEF